MLKFNVEGLKACQNQPLVRSIAKCKKFEAGPYILKNWKKVNRNIFFFFVFFVWHFAIPGSGSALRCSPIFDESGTVENFQTFCVFLLLKLFIFWGQQNADHLQKSDFVDSKLSRDSKSTKECFNFDSFVEKVSSHFICLFEKRAPQF